MLFSKKLTLLMEVIQVSNRQLAEALSVDPSLISRWRTGSRVPVEKGNYLRKIASYFDSQAGRKSQKLALYELMGMEFNEKQQSLYSISELLYSWLEDDSKAENKFVSNFFNTMEQAENAGSAGDDERIEIKTSFAKRRKIESLKGINGKREGVIDFLSAVAAADEKLTLLLYSDENMEWLTEDYNFYLKWRQLLKEVIIKGHKIKIIHTIKRDLKVLLKAIDYWLPLYMTGRIEPYFFPHYNRHVFQRTLFIAPGLAALTSTNFSGNIERSEQFYYRDHKKIEELTAEFEEFLELCRPLMRIYKNQETQNFSELQLEFDRQQAEMITFSDMPSFSTMPKNLLLKLLKKRDLSADYQQAVINLHRDRSRAFINNLQQNKVKEIVYLPKSAAQFLKTEELKINDFFSEWKLLYQPEDYIEHLKNIKLLLSHYPNYSFCRAPGNLVRNTFISIKADRGVIIAQNNDSPIIFAINQQKLVETFWKWGKGV